MKPLSEHTLFEKAQALHQAGETDAALACYQLLLREQPRHAEALNHLAFLYYQQGLLADAKVCVQRAIEIDPENGAYWHHLGVICLKALAWQDAKQCLEKALSLQPQSPDILNSLGNYWLYQKKTALAEQKFQQALSLEQTHFDTLHNLGRLHIAEGRYAEGIACCERLLSHYPNTVSAHHQLGFACFQQRDFSKSLHHFLTTLTLNPDFVPGHLGAATVYGETEDWAHAIFHYQQALLLDPSQTDVQNNLAVLLLKENKPDAISFLEEITKYHSDPAEIYAQIGHVYFKRKNWRQAEYYFLKAHVLRPHHFDDLYNLGSVQQKQKKDEAALKHYKLALALKPHDPSLLFLIASLEQQTPDAAPHDFVRDLFDQYAPLFESDMAKLAYQTPEKLLALFRKFKLPDHNKPLLTLDLGCGTGLMGKAWFHAFPSAQITGVDLSIEMLKKAIETGVYQTTTSQDMAAFLDQTPPFTWDVILAADVLVYWGDLNPLFQKIAHALKKGGSFLGSIEKSNSEQAFALNRHARYQHSQTHLMTAAQQTGLKMSGLEEAILRENQGEPVTGFLFLLEKPEGNLC